MFLQRSMVCTHDAVREWERKLAPRLSDTLRQRRHGTIGNRWYVDETYLRIRGQWRSLYRARERDGHLVDRRLSATRDLAAAEACFRSAWTVTGVTPTRITPDGHDAYPRAIWTVLGDHVRHRTHRYLNTHLEPDHRGIQPRYRPTTGLKTVVTAARFCRLFDEVRALRRPQTRRNPRLSRAPRRAIHQRRFRQLRRIIAAASLLPERSTSPTSPSWREF